MLACQPAGEAADPTVDAGIRIPIATDHHVHLLGPDLIRDWKAVGVPFSRPDSAYLVPDRLMAEVGRAILVPMGHAYGNSELRAALELSVSEEEQRVARENDHLLAQAARFPDRAVAFCSAPALRPYALRELTRCAAAGGGGIKLHLAASEVDLREPDHLQALATIAAWAAERRLPILLHLDTQQRGTEVEHVTDFLHAVLEPHPDLVVVIAHLGGSGGYGRWTQAVFKTINEWLASQGDTAPRAYFDLSAVVLAEESEGVPATTDAEAERLAQDLRSVPIDRLVFGSDAPSFDPGDYARSLIARGVVGRGTLDSIITNAPP
jgi:predicted TIM-barrel fold metal-dependent hydrolase